MGMEQGSWGLGWIVSLRDHHFSMTAMATGCSLMFSRVLITNITSTYQFSKISRAHPWFENFRFGENSTFRIF